MQNDRYLTIANGAVELTRTGLLQVDRLLPAFFEPEHRGTRSVLADIPPELVAKLNNAAIGAYRALRVRDYGRVDFRVTESGEAYVIEVNASCYLERSSEFAVAAKAAGIEYAELIDRIARLAVERHEKQLAHVVLK